MMSMADLVAIGVETTWIYSGCALEKEFIELIYMNLLTILYQIMNQVDSCHGFGLNPLTWDTKDMLWMDSHVLAMT